MTKQEKEHKALQILKKDFDIHFFKATVFGESNVVIIRQKENDWEYRKPLLDSDYDLLKEVFNK